MTAARKVALFATHPIQYHAPWFRAIVAEGIRLHVFFSFLPDAREQAIGFGGRFEWDVGVTKGYDWSVLPQDLRQPSLDRFGGLRNGGLGRTLSESSPDAVILTGWNSLPLLQAAVAAVQLGIPRIVRGESNSLRPRGWLKRTGHKALMSLFDLFVTIGEGNRKFYEDSGVRPERLVDGGYFVDVPYFAAVAKREVPRRSILRERWKIPADAICFLFCGKCQAKKRPLDFIRSLALVSKEYPGRVHGLVAGTGELESQMRSVAELTGAAVTFAGFLNQSEIGTAYAAADCLVLPSDDRETWGLVTNEAMIFGLPAIVSDRVGCGPDLVKEGETGFTFPVGETEALAGRMSALLASPARIRTMGSAAQMQVASYSPERGARAVVEAMRRIEGGAF